MAKRRVAGQAEPAAEIRRTVELTKRIDDWVRKNGEASQCETMRPLLFRSPRARRRSVQPAMTLASSPIAPRTRRPPKNAPARLRDTATALL